jgi:hypothetical protein
MLININKATLPNNEIGVNISLINSNTTDLYLDTLRRLLVCFDEQYTYRHNMYNNTPHLENKLKEMVSNDMFIHNNTISDNILDIKRQIDFLFNKYIPASTENVNENTEGLDLDLMDKITPLVLEGKEILLKNIVKEVNGSAKGLSDFVIMFTKYRQSIIKYNGIEYFQRKGCHFLRKF